MNSLPTIKKRNSKKKAASTNLDNNDEEKDDEVVNNDDNGDETDEDEEDEKLKPWDESNGYFGILSRMIKNYPATFIWTVRSANIDYNLLQKEQILNHYNKNGAFTTKVCSKKLFKHIINSLK